MKMRGRSQYLAALGIDVFTLRGRADSADEVQSGLAAESAAPRDIALLDWADLQTTVASCVRCELHRTRTQTVFGVGNRQAAWMIIGEAPGAEEDRRGEPFVGRAGKLLDEMLRSVDLSRDTVFIANILKCRPPGNRDPSASEAGACRGYLERQIELLAPRLILAVGRIAAQQLLGSDAPLGRLRGQLHKLTAAGIPLVVTYHPAYLLRSPKDKRKAWQDLCMARRVTRKGAA
jgi:DNA polymerase